VPLFRRRPKEDPRGAELIARLQSRRDELLGPPDPGETDRLTTLFEELGLEAQRIEEIDDPAWFLNLGEGWTVAAWLPDLRVFTITITYEEPPLLSLNLLAHNGDGLLTWYLVDESDERVNSRVLVAMDGFDRQLALAALEAAAYEIDSKELAPRLRAQLESPPADGVARLESALDELGLDSRALGDDPWPGRVVDTELGPLELRVVPGGHSIALTVELDRSRQPENPDVAWWMLKLSAAMARITVILGEDGQWIVRSGFVVPNRPVSAQALAWAMINLLNLARQFATLN
jgi:hypothetical protein